MHEHNPNLLWSVIKNATSQTGGRALLAAIRFVVAVIVVRYAGVERFGEYSLVLTLLLVTDWIADFALTDVAVREICRNPAREPGLLRALAGAKVVQAVVAIICLLALLWGLGYEVTMVRAGIIGGIGTLFVAPTLVYRAFFKAHLTMERDVGAEIIGASASVAMIWMVSARGGSLEALVGCFVASRAITLVAVLFLGRRMPSIGRRGPLAGESVGLFRAAAPLGAAGLMVAVYNSLDLVMLSKLTDARAVGLFSGAQRFVFPVLIAIDAVGSTLFPVMASFWKQREAEFRFVVQRGVEAAFVIAAGAFCVMQVTPSFLLDLLGPGMREATPLLRLLALALTIRAATFILAPILLVTGMQRYALWLTALALISKAGLLAWLIPHHGLLGVGYAWLATDLLVGLVPALILTQRVVGFRIRLACVPRVAAASAASIGLSMGLGLSDSVLGLLVVSLTYPATIVALRVVTLREIGAVRNAIRKRFGSGGESGSPGSGAVKPHELGMVGIERTDDHGV